MEWYKRLYFTCPWACYTSCSPTYSCWQWCEVSVNHLQYSSLYTRLHSLLCRFITFISHFRSLNRMLISKFKFVFKLRLKLRFQSNCVETEVPTSACLSSLYWTLRRSKSLLNFSSFCCDLLLNFRGICVVITMYLVLFQVLGRENVANGPRKCLVIFVDLTWKLQN